MSANPAVKIVSVEPYVVDLPAYGQFEVAGHGRFDVATATSATPTGTTSRVLTKVTGSNGMVGWGESRGNPKWSEETAETVYWGIKNHLGPSVMGCAIWDFDDLHQRMDDAIKGGLSIGQPTAKAGIDVATYDLLGKCTGMPAYQLLGGKRCGQIQLGWLTAGHDEASIVQHARQGLSAGYSAFKVKIGSRGLRADVRAVELVRDTVGPDAYLWVDANQRYSTIEARQVAQALHEYDVGLFEQPIRAGDLLGLAQLTSTSLVPIAVDESVRAPADLLQLARLNADCGVVLKVQRSAGLWRSRQIGELAAAGSIGLAGSGLTESDVGFAASLHLFARFGISRAVDLNGRQFIDSPYTEETFAVDGDMAKIPDRPGLGVNVDVDRLDRLIRPMPG